MTRRARRSCCLSTVVLLAVAAAGGAASLGWLAGVARDLVDDRDPGAATVLRVVDGDTLLVRRSGEAERLRLLGVDAPEASSTRYGRPECGGRRARRAARAWVARARRRVELTGDRLAPERDRYGRLLAGVRTRRGGELGAWLVRRGLARTVGYGYGPLAAHPRLLSLEARARGLRAGLWSRCPGWARRHAIPFTSLPSRRGAREADKRPLAAPMAALLATSGARR